MNTEDTKRIAQELRIVPEIADLPDDVLLWLAQNVREVTFESGQILAKEGDPADSFVILIEGGLQLRVHVGAQDMRVWDIEPGEVSGKLPYSRLVAWPGTVRATGPGRALLGSTSLFAEMIRDQPSLTQRLVWMMSDRIRFVTREDQQEDKMSALGKLSAGLAHELNNPAASAKRSALALSEALDALRESTSHLDSMELNADQRLAIVQFERQALQRTQAPVLMDSLDQSEKEDEIASWLATQRVTEAGRLATVLSETDLDVEWLKSFREKAGESAFPDALRRIVWHVQLKRLAKEIESSTGRISELVRAIKEYSYMDQAPVQEIDVHQGLESTLVMLRYKLKHGIEVVKQFDTTLPRIHAYGSELNQVWTNLIDNAADAMKNAGTLTVRTTFDSNCLLVEIRDTGPGIPQEIQGKVFEPFFTTKQIGEGTGLGLDTVYRIVRKHHGSIRVESQPGNTRFFVRLPIQQPAN